LAIKLSNICKSYGEKKVLQNINLTLHPGEITCLMGASGIGKTTLVNIIAGITPPDSGKIILAPSGNLAIQNLCECEELTAIIPISVVFQEDRLLEWETALTNVLFVATKEHKKQAVELLTQAGLADSINKKAAELSGGMKRRVSICRALIANSNLLILDEPFKGLDSETKPIIMNMVKQYSSKEKYVLCVTHDASEVEFLGGKIAEIFAAKMYTCEVGTRPC